MTRIFTLLAITFITVFQGFAQNHVNYDRDTRWFIGLNLGGTWTTQTEVPYHLRGGYGFTFGKSFGMKQDKLFSWDIRARFLHAQLQGQATSKYMLDSTSSLDLSQYETSLQTYQDSLGFFIPNYKTNLIRGAVELVLNTNRLRQNTGWNLSLFGGLGITGYHVSTDLTKDGFTYDYDLVKNTSKSNLINLQDNYFETDLVGNGFSYEADWMPSFGFGISKQVTPYFAVGLEHKMTWTRTNLFDGMPNNFDGTSSNVNDKYHYTALTFKFHLFQGEYMDDDPIVNDPIEDDPIIDDPIIDDPVSRKKPIIDIYDPNTSPHTTTENSFRIKANIYYVEGRSDITFKQDGNLNTNFTYNHTTDKFESRVILHPGQNLFEINARNDAGADYKSVIIIYQKEEEPKNPPIVTITNPSYTPYYTKSNVFGLVSTVLNVERKSQIKVYLNGVNLNAFSYNIGTNSVNASLNLKEGTNTVTVTASNNVGSDSKTVQIIFKREEKQQPPIISFINPNVDPYNTTVSNINIRATALNVASKSDLTVRVNGKLVNSFSFNTTSKEVYFNTSLVIGANIVEIKGVNVAGMDEESTTIIYSRPQSPKLPIVTFMDPNIDPITVYSASYTISAKVENVSSKSYIVLKINGVTSTLFSYSTSSDLMGFTTSLVEGSNVIEIKGTNKYGEDIETTTIIYKKEIVKAPPIVSITYPAVDNIEFASPEITLIAEVLNVSSSSDISVSVNGVITTAFTYNTYTKGLNLPLVLVEGSNIIQITGTNESGADAKTRFIKYKKPLVPSPPTVDFINPSTSPYNVIVPTFTVTANTTHIDSKSQIVLKQNGELVSDALYSFIAGNQIVYNATLIYGNNIFEVSVENEDGANSDITIINFEQEEEPCIVPTVGYISPVPYSTVTDPNVTIDANINNFSDGTVIELKLNGASQGYMTYNSGTATASKSIVLAEGSNAVNVIVTNECGTNQATFTLIYDEPDAPCNLPTLSTFAGAAGSFTTKEESTNLSLVATNVTEASELTVKLNGTEIPFTFDAGTGTIIIPEFVLKTGVNTVTITAKTDCGGAVIVFTITREACIAPIISKLSPMSGATFETSSVLVTAVVSDATAEDIILLVNGVSQAFSFDEVTHVLSQAITLSIGANTIQIDVNNACGKDSEKMRVTRNIPCESIITNLLLPTKTIVTSMVDVYTITLNAKGITNVDQITATLNGGGVIPKFDLISGDITLSNLKLIDGENKVVVGMINDCDKGSVSYTITYNGCKKPVIAFNKITPGMVVKESVFTLSAVVTNVEDAGEITVEVNGKEIDFDFNAKLHVLTAIFPLVEGSNSIDIQVNGCEKASESISIVYEVPCLKNAHILMKPNSLIVSSVEDEYEITLRAIGVTMAIQVWVKLNGNYIPYTFNTETEVISIPTFALVDGENSVIVSLRNECSSDLINYTINYDGCKAPVITLGSNPTAVSKSLYEFEANISNIGESKSIQLILNGTPIPVPFVFNSKTGGLIAELNLKPGKNTITITANGCEKSTLDFIVDYTIPCTPISYSLSHPAKVAVEVADKEYNISLIVQHVTKENISVKLRGKSLPFTYADNVLSINRIALEDGANNVVVKVTNACSSETINYTIEHNHCSTPEIDLSANKRSVESASYSFVATIIGAEAKKDIVVLLNNNPISFEFDAVNGTLNAFVNLIKGTNTIKVNVNGCATATESIRVSYSIPCDGVSYDLVSPSKLISETAEETINIRLNTANVDSKTVTATLNGKPMEVTFVGGVVNLEKVPMSDGANIITISFGNECSSETVTFTVSHDYCDTPRIQINGLKEGQTLTEKDLVFFANVYNVADRGDVILKLNGAATPFELNVASNLLQASLSLKEGVNDIELIIRGCETVSKKINIYYNPPCASPTYSMISPKDTKATVEGASYTITLSVANVNSKQINVKMNGASIPFTFSSGTVIIEAAYLGQPKNSVLIVLENECGVATINYEITYVIEEEDCMSTIAAVFGKDFHSVVASSNKDLINVVLNLDNGTTELIENVKGKRGTFTPKDKDRCIVGVWIRSGCNVGRSGEPHGQYISNPDWKGECIVDDPCSPITYSFVTPNRFTLNTTVNPYSIVFNTTNLESANDITTTLNGRIVSAVFDKGRVTLSGIKMDRGLNTIQFTLKNDCSTKILKYNITYTPYENPIDDGNGNNGGKSIAPPPSISPISPVSTKATVTNQIFSLKTKVLNVAGKSNIEVIVNGVKFSGFTYSTSTKKLSAIIRLNTGVNTIKIKANNGQSASLVYTITYSKKVNNFEQNNNNNNNNNNQGDYKNTLTPRLDRISPKTGSYTVTSSTFVLKARAINVMSKSRLTLTVNGVKTTNFSFSSSSKIMSAVLRLKIGTNNIRIEARNGDKKASINYIIKYNKPAKREGNGLNKQEKDNNNNNNNGNNVQTYKKPVFRLVSPTTSKKTVKSKTFLLRTKVLNVRSKSNITLTINGVKISSFTFNSSTGELVATLQLRAGTNAIRITAKNGNQVATTSYSIKYEVPIKSDGQNNGIKKDGNNNNSAPVNNGGIKKTNGVKRL